METIINSGIDLFYIFICWVIAFIPYLRAREYAEKVVSLGCEISGIDYLKQIVANIFLFFAAAVFSLCAYYPTWEVFISGGIAIAISTVAGLRKGIAEGYEKSKAL